MLLLGYSTPAHIHVDARVFKGVTLGWQSQPFSTAQPLWCGTGAKVLLMGYGGTRSHAGCSVGAQQPLQPSRLSRERGEKAPDDKHTRCAHFVPESPNHPGFKGCLRTPRLGFHAN